MSIQKCAIFQIYWWTKLYIFKFDFLYILILSLTDKLTVEWYLKSANVPIGLESYKVKNISPKEIMEKLPTEELNLYIKQLPSEVIKEENN